MKTLYTLLICIVLSSFTCIAQTDRTTDISNVVVHDPTMALCQGSYYLFATGNGISVMSSKDLKNWKMERPVFEKAPAWATRLIPEYKGHTWAPDIIFHNGLYHLFYSCSSFGKNTSAIGHATNITLDPTAPNFKWTDHGMILQSIQGRDNWNAIDPNIVIGNDGSPWMAFGSFWDGIKLVKLTNDLMALSQPEEWYSLSRRTTIPGSQKKGNGAVEAPFIMRHNGFYYLFVSFDYCCKGTQSNYKVAVGRSKEVTGPYLDKNGIDMAEGGGTILIQGDSVWAGIGHNAAYHFNGTDYFVAHAYSIAENGTPKLLLKPITWTDDGWPEIKD